MPLSQRQKSKEESQFRMLYKVPVATHIVSTQKIKKPGIRQVNLQFLLIN